MAYTTDLETTRTNIASRLASITSSPKPSYNVNGQQVSWTEYQKMLFEQLEKINAAIAAGEVDSEPFEIVSRGIT